MTRRGMGTAALVCGAAGLAGIAAAFAMDARAAAAAYLAAYAFAASTATGALVLLLAARAAGVAWTAGPRAAAAGCAEAVVPLAPLVLPMVLAAPVLYPWAGGDDATAVPGTEAYLAVPWFALRAAVYLAVWMGAAWLLRRGAGRRASALALAAVGFAATFAAFDWTMTLQPAWASAAWGLYWLAGGIAAALAVVAVAAHLRPRDARTEDVQWLGKLLLAAVLLWAYVAYTQYLVVWIADIPREAAWLLPRATDGGRMVGWMLIVGHASIPVALLLSWRVKRSGRALAWIGGWMLAMHALDLAWIVLPALEGGMAVAAWAYPAALLGMGGCAAAWIAWRPPATASDANRPARAEAAG